MSTPTAAAKALAAYNRARGARNRDTTESEATDLIADLLIMLHRQGEDAASIARMAIGHYEEETKPHPGPIRAIDSRVNGVVRRERV